MIKANKDRFAVSGEITVVAAEYMSITAYMAEIFGADSVLDFVECALKEVEGKGD